MSRLQNGLIPPGTVCPFRDRCTEQNCQHLGIDSPYTFSCYQARYYDLEERVSALETHSRKEPIFPKWKNMPPGPVAIIPQRF